jgi:hypothetical protein
MRKVLTSVAGLLALTLVASRCGGSGDTLEGDGGTDGSVDRNATGAGGGSGSSGASGSGSGSSAGGSGGGSGGGGTDAGAALPCGTAGTCVDAGSYCLIVEGLRAPDGSLAPQDSCPGYPASCASAPTCDCLVQAKPGCTCNDGDAGFSVTCAYP